jgi:hypothetical protein
VIQNRKCSTNYAKRSYQILLDLCKLTYNQNKKQTVPSFYKESTKVEQVIICDPKLNGIKVTYHVYFVQVVIANNFFFYKLLTAGPSSTDEGT